MGAATSESETGLDVGFLREAGYLQTPVDSLGLPEVRWYQSMIFGSVPVVVWEPRPEFQRDAVAAENGMGC